MNPTILIAVVIGVVAVGLVGVSSIDFIQAGERGVTTHWGAVNPDEAPRTQGLQFKTPFQDNIIKMDIQTQRYPSLPQGIEADAGDTQQGVRIASTSKDIQDVFTEVVVIYHLNGDRVNELYANIGTDYDTEVLQPILKQVTKQTMAQFSAEELVTQRAQLKTDILINLSTELDNLKQCSGCIVVEDIALTNIDFTPQFSEAIESKVKAVQKALEAKNDLERIKFEADQAREIAQGKADAKAIEAEGEARYISTIADAISNNPEFMDWYGTARWNGEVPQVIGGGAVPFVNIPVNNP